MDSKKIEEIMNYIDISVVDIFKNKDIKEIEEFTDEYGNKHILDYKNNTHDIYFNEPLESIKINLEVK